MKRLEVYEPAMCCSTGVCGPSVDETLLRFSADVQWLKANGVEVERLNLSSNPQAFVENPIVQKAIEGGTEKLPLFIVKGEAKHSGTYPDRKTLGSWFQLSVVEQLPKLKIG